MKEKKAFLLVHLPIQKNKRRHNMYYQLSEMMTDKRHMSAPPHHSYQRGYSR
jgi:hypothetical protein